MQRCLHAVHRAADNAAGIARPLAYGNEPSNAAGVKGILITGNAHRRGCSGFNSYENSFAYKAIKLFVKSCQAPLKRSADEVRQKQTKVGRSTAGAVGAVDILRG